MEKGLKNCPFCGGKANIETNVSAIWVRCSVCKVESRYFKPSLDCCAKDKAIETWNARVEPEKPAEGDKPTVVDTTPPTTIEELNRLIKDRLYEILNSLPYEDEKRLEIINRIVGIMRATIDFERYAK